MSFDRVKAIQELSDLMWEDFQTGELTFDDLICDGFVGLTNMTDEQLMQELTDRDVSYNFGENDD